MLRLLKQRRDTENGFTLIELMIVVVIIGILAAIAIPIFANQQKEAIHATVKSDVRNTASNVAASLVKQNTAVGFKTYKKDEAVPTLNAGEVAVLTVNSGSGSNENIIKITNPVDKGTDPRDASGSGSWLGYQITGTSPADPDYYYTINSAIGKEWSSDNIESAPVGGTSGGTGGANVAGTPVVEYMASQFWDTSNVPAYFKQYYFYGDIAGTEGSLPSTLANKLPSQPSKAEMTVGAYGVPQYIFEVSSVTIKLADGTTYTSSAVDCSDWKASDGTAPFSSCGNNLTLLAMPNTAEKQYLALVYQLGGIDYGNAYSGYQEMADKIANADVTVHFTKGGSLSFNLGTTRLGG